MEHNVVLEKDAIKEVVIGEGSPDDVDVEAGCKRYLELLSERLGPNFKVSWGARDQLDGTPLVLARDAVGQKVNAALFAVDLDVTKDWEEHYAI